MQQYQQAHKSSYVITRLVSHHTQQLLTLFYSEAVQLQYRLMIQSCYRPPVLYGYIIAVQKRPKQQQSAYWEPTGNGEMSLSELQSFTLEILSRLKL